MAEYLFCQALSLTPTPTTHIDAVDRDGKRYQIKGRRVTERNPSREFGAIREMAGQHFDFLAGLLFGEMFDVRRAALIPHAVVMERATFVERSNSQLLAHHFTQAGQIEAAIEWWGKAGQQSVERSALVEAAEQFTRALTQVMTLPATPKLRREQIKLQVALISPLMQVIRCAGNQGSRRTGTSADRPI